MTENKEQKREDMIGGDEIAVVPANEEIADTLLPKKEEEDELIVKFRKPYKFEDDTFTELDLHGLEDLTGRTLTAIEKAFHKTGVSSFVPESTTTYAEDRRYKSDRTSGGVFRRSSAAEIQKIKNAVEGFLYKDE